MASHSIPHWKCAWIMMTHCSCSPFLYPLASFDLHVPVCFFAYGSMDSCSVLLNDVDTCCKYSSTTHTTQDMGICLMQWHCKFRVGSFPTSTHNTCPTCRLMRRSSADTSPKTMIHIEKDSSVSVCLSHPGEPHLE